MRITRVPCVGYNSTFCQPDTTRCTYVGWIGFDRVSRNGKRRTIALILYYVVRCVQQQIPQKYLARDRTVPMVIISVSTYDVNHNIIYTYRAEE